MPQRDNTAYKQKVAIRRKALDLINTPVVLETHGGKGGLYNACYTQIPSGVVLEKDPEKIAVLVKQRPAWAVYEGDCVRCLQAGAGAHLPINFLDIDPYGEPWPVMDAFLQSERPHPDILVIVVNDGLMQKLRIGAWNVGSMQGMVQKYGNKLHTIYLDVCGELMQEKAAKAGYNLNRFAGYYCGHLDQMTHYLAVLKRDI